MERAEEVAMGEIRVAASNMQSRNDCLAKARELMDQANVHLGVAKACIQVASDLKYGGKDWFRMALKDIHPTNAMEEMVEQLWRLKQGGGRP